MRVVDTNVLVRLLVGDDAEQTILAEQYVVQGVWISHIVLIEAMWVLKHIYRQGPQAIADAVEMMLTHDSLSLERAGDVQAALQVFRQKPALGFIDCLIVQSAIAAGHVPLGTFDAGLAKLSGAERIV